MNSLLQQHAVGFTAQVNRVLDSVTITRSSTPIPVTDDNRKVNISVYRNEAEPDVLHVQFVEEGTLEEALNSHDF